MSLVIDLSPEVERQLREEAARAGQETAECARLLLEAQLAAVRRQRDEGAVALMEQWLAEPANEEDERWPELERALDENRAGQRKLFGA